MTSGGEDLIQMFFAPHRGGEEYIGVCLEHMKALGPAWRHMGEKPVFRHKRCAICEFANGEMTRRYDDIAYLLNKDEIYRVREETT